MSVKRRLILTSLLFPLIAPFGTLFTALNAAMLYYSADDQTLWILPLVWLMFGIISFIEAYVSYLRASRQLLRYERLPRPLVVATMQQATFCYRNAFRVAVIAAGRADEVKKLRPAG